MASSRQVSLPAWQLYAAIVVGTAALITSIVDYKKSLDLANDPNARPLVWTSEDEQRYQQNHQRLHTATDKTTEQLLQRITELERWKEQHMDFATERSIIQSEQDAKQDANIQELYRLHDNDKTRYYQRIPRQAY